MALTDAEITRIEAIETIINQLQVAVTNLVSKLQMRQLLLIKQEEIDALTTRVTTLESQIALLQEHIE